MAVADFYGVAAETVVQQVDTITISSVTPAALSKVGIVSYPSAAVAGAAPTADVIKVFDVTTATALVLGTDYTLTDIGDGPTQTYTVSRISTSSNSANGNTCTVTYKWGTVRSTTDDVGIAGTAPRGTADRLLRARRRLPRWLADRPGRWQAVQLGDRRPGLGLRGQQGDAGYLRLHPRHAGHRGGLRRRPAVELRADRHELRRSQRLEADRHHDRRRRGPHRRHPAGLPGAQLGRGGRGEGHLAHRHPGQPAQRAYRAEPGLLCGRQRGHRLFRRPSSAERAEDPGGHRHLRPAHDPLLPEPGGRDPLDDRGQGHHDPIDAGAQHRLHGDHSG